jgi:hypothetical protein
MGASGARNGGSDAGFANTQKSKLTKKNQELVDTSFKDRGALKIKRTVEKFPTPTLVLASAPLQAGSKVTRDFFTNKVLGSKNYKDISKADFEAMSVSQQESIYKDYSRSRLSGKTDAYGNPIISGDSGGNNQVAQTTTMAAATAPTTAEVSQSSATDAATVDTDDPNYIKRKNKRKGRSLTILTSSRGATDSLTLGKRSLLGQA